MKVEIEEQRDEEEGQGRLWQRRQERRLGETVANALHGQQIHIPYKFHRCQVVIQFIYFSD